MNKSEKIKKYIQEAVQKALLSRVNQVTEEDIKHSIVQCLERTVGYTIGQPKIELVEESDEMKMVREIMEEIKEEYEYKISMQVPIHYINCTFKIEGEDEDKG